MKKAELIDAVGPLIRFTFARSGGPGGQNVNKVASKAVARLSLADLGFLPDADRRRVEARLANRVTSEGDIVIAVQDTREQGRNREIAVARMAELVAHALVKPKSRVKTRPSRAAREARLRVKKLRSSHKRMRGPAEEE
jgi:ribosome-associated protein